METLEKKELAWFKPDPHQPRKTFGLAELEALEESLFVRQDIPLIAFLDGTIIDGERRWRAAQRRGRIKTLDVVITDKRMTPSELRVFQITSSVHRAALTGYEMCQACVDMLALNPNWKLVDLAAHLQMEASSITRYVSALKSIPPWIEALKAGTVGVSDCYEASKLPEADQPALLALKLAGASRNDIAAVGKKSRNGGKASEKVSSIKVALCGGISVVIKGQGLDLDQAIEQLGIASKAIKKAVADGLDARTAQNVWRDKAKAGV
jgi:ParB family transcriptional regulator, chromosome partitioning protein